VCGRELRLAQTQRLEALGTLRAESRTDSTTSSAPSSIRRDGSAQADSGQPIRRHIERVLQAGARARLLVRRILDFSRSGVAEPRAGQHPGRHRGVVAMLTPTLPQGLPVKTELRPATPPCW